MPDIPTAVQIATVRGIPLRLHLTFLLVLPFFAFVMADYFTPEGSSPEGVAYLWGGVLAVALFVCVMLHELSHSLVAQRYGIRVRGIVLLPIGGVSQMEDMPREPRKELWVSFAGPLTNFVIAAPLLALTYAGLVPDLAPNFREFVRWVGLLNVLLGGFNLLLPAFPMDGGRILRALLAARLDFQRATRIAAGLGRALAFAMGLLGFFTLAAGGIWLLLIAFFIYMGATEEERAVRILHTLGNLRVRDLMTATPVVLRPDESLERAFQVMVETKHIGFPVVGPEGRVVGFLGLPELGKVERLLHGTTTVAQAMRTEVPTVGPEVLATDALREMGNRQEEHLVVLEQDRLAGILTKTDVSRIVRILAVEQGARPEELGL